MELLYPANFNADAMIRLVAFDRHSAVAAAAAGMLADVVKPNIYLTDLGSFPARQPGHAEILPAVVSSAHGNPYGRAAAGIESGDGRRHDRRRLSL